jgi:uncharacterized membrane protein
MERLNRAVALAAIPALVAVIVIDVRTIAGHDSVSGKLEDDIVWWLITGITVVVVTTLQVSARFYVAKYQNGWRWLPGSRGWMPNLLNFKRMPVWCKSIAYAVLAISIALTLYAWLGQPSNVQGDVRFRRFHSAANISRALFAIGHLVHGCKFAPTFNSRVAFRGNPGARVTSGGRFRQRDPPQVVVANSRRRLIGGTFG